MWVRGCNHDPYHYNKDVRVLRYGSTWKIVISSIEVYVQGRWVYECVCISKCMYICMQQSQWCHKKDTSYFCKIESYMAQEHEICCIIDMLTPFYC